MAGRRVQPGNRLWRRRPATSSTECGSALRAIPLQHNGALHARVHGLVLLLQAAPPPEDDRRGSSCPRGCRFRVAPVVGARPHLHGGSLVFQQPALSGGGRGY